PVNKYMIAQELDWAGDEEWVGNSGGADNHQVTQKRSDKWVPDPLNPPVTPPYASGIHLLAGTNYYIMAAHHEGGGGDHVEATYKLISEPDPQNGDVPRINAFTLTAYPMALDGAYIVVSNPPSDTLAFQSSTATFRISAGSAYFGDYSGVGPAIAYQWQTAPAGSSTFTNILGGN